MDQIKNLFQKLKAQLFKEGMEQGFLFGIGFFVILAGFSVKVESDAALVLGALLVILAALDPKSIKKIVLKKLGVELEFHEYNDEEKKSLSKLQVVTKEESDSKSLPEDARKLIDAAEKRAPEERPPEDYLTLAIKAWEEENYEQGINLAYTGLNLNPKNQDTRMWLYNILGIIFTDREAYQLAKENLTKALETKDNQPAVHFNLGIAHYKSNNYEAAERDFQRAIKLNPRYTDAHFNLGCTYQKQANFKEAKQYYRHALEINPEYSDANVNLGLIFFETGENDKALENFEKALKSKDPAEYYAALAITLFKMDKPTEALDQYKRAIQSDGNFLDVEFLKEHCVWPEKACETAQVLIDQIKEQNT